MHQIGQSVNEGKSNYRLLMLDKVREEFDRIAVQFGGLAELMDKFPERVAAAARIPRTRWLGASPGGLNATGDSDMDNYVLSIETARDDILSDPVTQLDEFLCRHAGCPEALTYQWVPLREMSAKDQAEASKLKAQAVREVVDGRFADEDEGRSMLDGDPIFGTLEGPAPEPDLTLFDPATNPFLNEPDEPDEPEEPRGTRGTRGWQLTRRPSTRGSKTNGRSIGRSNAHTPTPGTTSSPHG